MITWLTNSKKSLISSFLFFPSNLNGWLWVRNRIVCFHGINKTFSTCPPCNDISKRKKKKRKKKHTTKQTKSKQLLRAGNYSLALFSFFFFFFSFAMTYDQSSELISPNSWVGEASCSKKRPTFALLVPISGSLHTDRPKSAWECGVGSLPEPIMATELWHHLSSATRTLFWAGKSFPPAEQWLHSSLWVCSSSQAPSAMISCTTEFSKGLWSTECAAIYPWQLIKFEHQAWQA